MKKRIIGMILSVIMLFTVVYTPISATAAAVMPDVIIAVGSDWLNGALWDPTFDGNALTETSDGVYSITYYRVPGGDFYDFKFALDYSWDNNMGAAENNLKVSNGEVYELIDNGSNFVLDTTVYDWEYSDVTLTVDMTGFNSDTHSGAMLAVDVKKSVEKDLTFTGGREGIDYIYDKGLYTVLTGTALTVTGTSFDNRIAVAEGVSANIILNGVNIDLSGGDDMACALNILGFADITLKGNNILISSYLSAGIQVNAGAGTVIGGTGSLTVKGGDAAAGIGGGNVNGGGDITVTGGTVNAFGGRNGAGIGGGDRGSTGTVNITGGTVTAEGGENGAGIGAGQYGNGAYQCDSNITVSGGNVTAKGGYNAAGIGGGYAGSGGTITVTDGDVTATGGENGAGIGGGANYEESGASGGSITVSGGTVTAVGGVDGDGIGGGYKGLSGTFSTGADGDAMIFASSVSDGDDKTEWDGIIFIGADGEVYSPAVFITEDATVPAGHTLTVPQGSSIYIEPDVTLTNDGHIVNNGTIYRCECLADPLDSYGVLLNNGTLTGDNTVKGHTHVFNQSVTEDKYKADTAYTYYKSCACTKASDSETFTTLPDMKFESVNISLGQDIKVNYYVTKVEGVIPQVKFTVNGYTKTVEGTDNGDQYKFVFTGVSPQWIGDSITAQLLVNGDEVAVKDYSVLTYLNALKSKTASELRYSDEKYSAMQSLIADLLIYGGAAQTYTGHKTDALVSDGVTGTEFVPVTETDAAAMNGTYLRIVSANVYFDSVNKIIFTFAAEDMTGVTFKMSVNGGEEFDVSYEDAGNGKYTVITPGISAVGFNNIYTVTAYKDGVADAKMRYSVRSYVYSKQNTTGAMADLAKATYNYGISANAFNAAK